MNKLAYSLLLVACNLSCFAQTDTLYNQGGFGGIWSKVIRQKISKHKYYYILYYSNGKKHSEGKAYEHWNSYEIGKWFEYDTAEKLIRINEYNGRGREKRFTFWNSSGKELKGKIKHPLFRRKSYFP